MRFISIFAVAVAGLVTLVSASGDSNSGSNPVHAPVAKSVAKAGVKFNIEWTPGPAKFVDIILRKGSNEKLLKEVLTITTRLPNVGLYFWTPKKELAGGDDYTIEIVSHDPESSNFSAKFTVNSNGPGITATTSSAYPSPSSPLSGSPSTDDADMPASPATSASMPGVSAFEGAAARPQFGGWVSMGLAAMVGMVGGGALFL